MPTKFEYLPVAKTNESIITIHDNRPTHERRFISTNGGSNYYYSDENFSMPLMDILGDRIKAKLNKNKQHLEIEITSLILSASKASMSGAQAFDGAMAMGLPPFDAVIAITIISTIEDYKATHSVWCQIEYKVFGNPYIESEQINVKQSDVKKAVIGLLLYSADSIGEKLRKEIITNNS